MRFHVEDMTCGHCTAAIEKAVAAAGGRATAERRPFVTAKIAQSLDGKVAAADRTSRWITSAASREHSHRLRGTVDANLPLGETARRRYGHPYWQFHRADLLSVLAEAAREAGIPSGPGRAQRSPARPRRRRLPSTAGRVRSRSTQ